MPRVIVYRETKSAVEAFRQEYERLPTTAELESADLTQYWTKESIPKVLARLEAEGLVKENNVEEERGDAYE